MPRRVCIHSFIYSFYRLFFFNQCQVICILFLTRTIKYFLPRAFLRTADVVISVPLKHQRPLLRKRTGESRTLRPLIYCASALRLPPIRRAQAHFRRPSASPPPWNPPQCASAQHLRFPPLSPSPPPLPSPSSSRRRGALTPVRRPEAGHRRRSPFPEDHVPAQPGGGPAPRPLPSRLSGSSPGESREEAGGERRGRGETLLSRRVGRSARPVSRRRTDVPPLLPTCAERRVEGRGVSGTGGRRCQPCRARDVCLLDLAGQAGLRLARWGAAAFLPRLRGYLCLEVI